MGRVRRIIAGVVSIMASMNLFVSAYAYDGIATNADSDVVEYQVATPNLYNDVADAEILESKLDIDLAELEEYLINAMMDNQQIIDITSFGISVSNENFEAITNYIFREIEEIFHINQLSLLPGSSNYIYVEPTYFYDVDKYSEMMRECEAVAAKLVEGVKDNDSLDDAEKALILHDRLALNCTYDYEAASGSNVEDMAFSMYGALVDGEAVCQGYAEAYNYLLKLVGVESYFCVSNQLNHGWNMVYVDGKPYHVDVAWDDGYVNGSVTHNYFLLSSEAFYNGVNGSTGHKATDYDTRATSTKYDSYYWQNSSTAFQVIGDEIYYIDNVSEKLVRESDRKELCSVSDIWLYTSDYSYWPGNYSKLSSDGINLLYSDSENVYKFDLGTNTSTIVFSPDLSVGAYYSIFGMMYDGEKIICDLFNSPNRDNENLMKHEEMIYIASENILVGDVNEDGEINSKDVTIIRRSLSGGWNINLEITMVDLDENGIVNSKDVSLVRRIAAGGW